MRSHASAYLKGLPKAALYRGRIHGLRTLAELDAILEEYGAAVTAFGAGPGRQG